MEEETLSHGKQATSGKKQTLPQSLQKDTAHDALILAPRDPGLTCGLRKCKVTNVGC